MEPLLRELLSRCTAFDTFARELVASKPVLSVDCHAAKKGKSGREYVLDVVVTTKAGEAPFVVDCQRAERAIGTKDLVELSEMMDDLGAAKAGMFFSGTLDASVEANARARRIELFPLSDLPPGGLKGTKKTYRAQALSWIGNYRDLQFGEIALIPLVEQIPNKLVLQKEFDAFQRGSDSLHLYSIKTGQPGDHLMTLMQNKQMEILQFFKSDPGFRSQIRFDRKLAVESPIRFDFSDYEFRQLHLSYGAVNLKTIEGRFYTFVIGQEEDFPTDTLALLPAAVKQYISPRKPQIVWHETQARVHDGYMQVGPVLEEAIVAGDAIEDVVALEFFFPPWVNYKMDGTEFKTTTNKIVVKPQEIKYN